MKHTNKLKTIDKIITKVDGKYGAPMGRSNIIPQAYSIFDKFIINPITKESKRIFDCAVPMSGCGAYDKGGAYWGLGQQLRVKYTKDLSYIEFYRASRLNPFTR